MITVIDYGMANLGSVLNMLKKVGAEAKASSRPEDILTADKLILPGVGAFDAGMAHLAERDLIEPLNRRVKEAGVPLLGICLGMQLLSRDSEEGTAAGLGWIPAHTIRFHFPPEQQERRIPHMGWNTVRVVKPHLLFEGLKQDARFYFVHSYHVVCDLPENVLATTWYGFDFVSVVASENVMGVQFHPEKSHKFGMRLLKNFVELF